MDVGAAEAWGLEEDVGGAVEGVVVGDVDGDGADEAGVVGADRVDPLPRLGVEVEVEGVSTVENGAALEMEGFADARYCYTRDSIVMMGLIEGEVRGENHGWVEGFPWDLNGTTVFGHKNVNLFEVA